MLKRFTFLLTLIIITGFSSHLNAQPSAPKGLQISQEAISDFVFVKLSWESIDQKKISYNIYRKEGAVQDSGSFGKFPMMSHNNSYSDYFVTPGKTYSYYITAKDRNGESLPSDTVEITLGKAAGKSVVSGKITDEKSGAGIPNAAITFIPLKGWNAPKVHTDSLGNYSAKLYQGKYLVSVQAPKYYSEFYDNAQSIFDASKITVDSAALELNISLKPITPPVYYTLSGKVTDTSGVPLRAKVEAIVLNSLKSFMHHYGKDRIRHAVTDSLGNYSLKLSGGDSVIIHVTPVSKKYIPEFYNNKKEFAEANPITINSDMTGLDFILEQKASYNNSISGTIKNEEGTGVVSSVTAFKLHEHGRGQFKHSVLTDSLGNYQISNLVPGEYILFVIPFDKYVPAFFKYDGSQTLKWKEADSLVVTESSQLTGIDVTLPAVPDSGFAEISGIVRDNNGDGISGAAVYIQDVNGNTSAFTTTDENGSYNLSGLVPGTYSVITDKFNYAFNQQQSVSLDYQSNMSQNVQLNLSLSDLTSAGNNPVIPSGYALEQNYPNPFNPTTIITYSIPDLSPFSKGGAGFSRGGFVTLKVYDILGREVATLVNTLQSAGNYRVNFDASKLSTGVYMYELRAGNFVQARKMMLLK